MQSRSIVATAFALSIGVLALAGWMALQSFNTFAQTTRVLNGSKDASLLLEQLLSALRDAETGQRGYLLTHDAAYLAPYTSGVVAVSTDTNRLASLAPPASALRTGLPQLSALAQLKLQELQQTIDLENAGRHADAVALVRTNAGKRTMDAIRALASGLQQQIARDIDRQRQEQTEARDEGLRSELATSTLAIGLLAALAAVVRRETARVRAGERRLAITLRSIGDAVIATDAAGNVEMMNPVAEAMTGWPAAQARGRPLSDVFRIINEETRETVESPVGRVLREKRVVGLANHTLLIGRDGVETPIDDSGAPITAEDGRIAGVVLVFRDASQGRQAEQTLRDADRRKDEFLATLAHELRNPLAPIGQAAQILRSPAATETQVRWSYEVIDRQVQNMARLLDDLLDVSRITRGRLELRKGPVQLNALIDSAIEMTRPLIETRRHQLQLEGPVTPVLLQADALRMSQVIANLLTNAAKYTPRGGTIRLIVRSDERELTLQVMDSGVGIDTDMLPRIFDMFVQARNAQAHGEAGLGIGLSLAKGIVELHGGTIEAHSDGVDRGSTFTVRLPLGMTGNTAEVTASGDAGVTAGPSRRVLVIDDNNDAAESLALLLRSEGHDVRAVYDGEQGLQVAATWQPQFVLLDIGMPRMDGYAVARRLRAAPWAATDGLTIVAISGWGQAQDRQNAMAAGFDQHFVKPVNVRELLRLIGRG